jgi:uncharacterized glyoxalase superfamily protein PhnB
MNKGNVKVNKLAPVLMVEDVAATIGFYEDALGFERVMTVPDEGPFVWGMAANGGVEIQFGAAKSFADDLGDAVKGRPMGGTLALYMDVDDVDALYKAVEGRVKIVKEIHETFYGTREFYMCDCNGYVLGFAGKKA